MKLIVILLFILTFSFFIAMVYYIMLAINAPRWMYDVAGVILFLSVVKLIYNWIQS